MSQMYETKSLKPNFLSSFSLMFIGLPFLCSEMGSLNLRFPLSSLSEECFGLGLGLNPFCRGELSFLINSTNSKSSTPSWADFISLQI